MKGLFLKLWAIQGRPTRGRKAPWVRQMQELLPAMALPKRKGEGVDNATQQELDL
jgi:hypothetical protein